jgi:hypothetical protein
LNVKKQRERRRLKLNDYVKGAAQHLIAADRK